MTVEVHRRMNNISLFCATWICLSLATAIVSCSRPSSKLESLTGNTGNGPFIITAKVDTVLKPVGRPPMSRGKYKNSELCFVSAGSQIRLASLANLASLKNGHFKVQLLQATPTPQQTEQPTPRQTEQRNAPEISEPEEDPAEQVLIDPGVIAETGAQKSNPLSLLKNSGYANASGICPMQDVYIFDSHFDGQVLDSDSKCCNFPLKKDPDYYCDEGRSFSASRDFGRLHAACDLLAPPGTPIYAVADGTVVQMPYFFYLGTDALEIRHSELIDGDGTSIQNAIVRYGEIAPGSAVDQRTGRLLKAGDKVKRGQQIARVGVLIDYDAYMLHWELFRGNRKGPLTIDYGGVYQRREDLMNPTEFLKRWIARKPN